MSPERAPRGERLRLALWTHQLVEYLLGALIIVQSINAGSAAPFIAAAGALLFLLAAFTDGPFAVSRWIPPKLHRVLDAVVIVVLVIAPVASGTTEPLAWGLCLLAAAAVAWLNWHTRWTRPAPRAPRRAPIGTDTAASQPLPKSVAESARSLGAAVDRTTRGASRAAGRFYGRSRARTTDGGEKPETNA